MIYLFVGLLIVVLVVIIIFSFPQFSPIPYFPSNKLDMNLIIRSLNLKNNQVVYDLGAGDGEVIFQAASYAKNQLLNTQFIAVDINPILVMIMKIRSLFHPNKKNIKILWSDMYKINFSQTSNHQPLITYYLYISPWFLEKTLDYIKSQLKSFTIVSYFYPIKSLKKIEKKIIASQNKIFIYKIN